MSISDLNHRITLQQGAETPDGGGGVTRSWAALGDTPEVYAAIEALSGNAQARLAQFGSRVTHRVTLRFRTDVRAGQRLLWQGAPYAIVFVRDPDGRGAWLEILAAQAS